MAVAEMAGFAQGPSLSREEIEAFLYKEARLLDERRYEEWLSLWAADGIYWVPMGPEDVDPNHHISIVYDDKVRREERVRRLRSESAWAFSPPAETARVISNIEADPDAQQGQVIVRATYLLGTYRKGKQDLYCGRILYRLRVDDDEPRLVLKKVVLINRDGIFDNLTALP